MGNEFEFLRLAQDAKLTLCENNDYGRETGRNAGNKRVMVVRLASHLHRETRKWRKEGRQRREKLVARLFLFHR